MHGINAIKALNDQAIVQHQANQINARIAGEFGFDLSDEDYQQTFDQIAPYVTDNLLPGARGLALVDYQRRRQTQQAGPSLVSVG